MINSISLYAFKWRVQQELSTITIIGVFPAVNTDRIGFYVL